ncbi:MAG TPA: enoyl-CoA hydratase, partial [Chroococcales cyanobacterium]
MTEALILREKRNTVEIIRLNRAKSRNSLSGPMMDALKSALDEIAADKSVRVVVLAAEGNVFCAGHDLKELQAHRADADCGRKFYEGIFKKCGELMQTIVHLPQPVIACVQGVATAAGCQLVASCDLAVASSASKFATPGVDIGLFCSTPMVALSRNVANKHAMQILLTGEMIDAEEALRMGLVNKVVAPGAELEASLELAEKIAAKSTRAVRIGKRAFYEQAEKSLSQAYEYTAAIMVDNLLDGDANEGICAFL